jgi:hypothetical protein
MSAQIEVQRVEDGPAYAFQVTVTEGHGRTEHRVTLSQADYERLSDGEASPEALVQASFEFLLEREPKEAILRTFDLPVIGRYFPEYERVIGRRL